MERLKLKFVGLSFEKVCNHKNFCNCWWGRLLMTGKKLMPVVSSNKN